MADIAAIFHWAPRDMDPMTPEDLARTNALRPTDPLREGEMLLLPKRVSAMPQPAVAE